MNGHRRTIPVLQRSKNSALMVIISCRSAVSGNARQLTAAALLSRPAAVLPLQACPEAKITLLLWHEQC